MKDHRKEVVFFGLGGTWNAVLENGKLVGSDFLGDEEFYHLEEKYGYFNKDANYNEIEWELAQYLYTLFKERLKIQSDITSKLSFAPQALSLIKGKSITLYDIPSEFMRAGVVAPTVAILLKWANLNPNSPILAAFGTDTADITVPPLLDTYTFDTNLPPFLFTGANRPPFQKNSDAPENFYDLARAATLDLPAGGYWIFAGQLFKVSDVLKTSPYESRETDNLATFFSPHSTSERIDYLVSDKSLSRKRINEKPDHISRITTTERLFHASQKVHIVDIGQEYELAHDIKKILDLQYKAVIIVGHSSGTVSNPIQFACAQAALQNKLVIIVSRCLASDVFEHYNYSLLNANTTYLRGKGKKIIPGYKLNKYVARSLAIRAVDENLDQSQTEALLQRYTHTRRLSEHDVFIL